MGSVSPPRSFRRVGGGGYFVGSGGDLLVEEEDDRREEAVLRRVEVGAEEVDWRGLLSGLAVAVAAVAEFVAGAGTASMADKTSLPFPFRRDDAEGGRDLETWSGCLKTSPLGGWTAPSMYPTGEGCGA